MLCKAPCIGISRTMHTFGQFQVVNVSEEIWITSVGYGEVHVGATQWLLIWTKNAQSSGLWRINDSHETSPAWSLNTGTNKTFTGVHQLTLAPKFNIGNPS
ncbi:hypothetical protein KC360_g78 [Hortaea werneckii]|nr:hypothetical protein KC360_g78 [Hortaea werneckii]